MTTAWDRWMEAIRGRTSEPPVVLMAPTAEAAPVEREDDLPPWLAALCAWRKALEK